MTTKSRSPKLPAGFVYLGCTDMDRTDPARLFTRKCEVCGWGLKFACEIENVETEETILVCRHCLHQFDPQALDFAKLSREEQEDEFPNLEWRTSSKGNRTVCVLGFRVTIYQHHGDYGFCIVRGGNVTHSDSLYATEHDAMAGAWEYIASQLD